MMYCSNCGTQIMEGDMYCSNCGSSIVSTNMYQQSVAQPSSYNIKKISGAFNSLLFVLVIDALVESGIATIGTLLFAREEMQYMTAAFIIFPISVISTLLFALYLRINIPERGTAAKVALQMFGRGWVTLFKIILCFTLVGLIVAILVAPTHPTFVVRDGKKYICTMKDMLDGTYVDVKTGLRRVL